MLKHALKGSVRAVLARLGRQNRAPWRESLLILMYHRVLPPDHPELPIIQPGMVVYPETFGMHLRMLKERFEVVHLGDWLAQWTSDKPLPKKACAITFDDGWRDNYDHAYPVLQAAGLPATIFLVSDKVGTPGTFWPECLARIIWNGGLGHAPAIWNSPTFAWLQQLVTTYPFGQRPATRNEIDAIIQQCKRFTDAELYQRLARMESHIAAVQTGVTPDLLDWDQVNEMARSGLVRFGSHTRNHVRLSNAIDGQVLLDEIQTSRRVIEAHTHQTADIFCYPNGDYTPEVKRLVQDHYQAACTTKRGWNDARSDRYQLRRIGLHQDVAFDETSFLARLSGWI